MYDPAAKPFATITPAPTEIWQELRKRPTPAWHPRAKLGIFIHWGPYSVPAWAEPSGALGAVPEDEWFAHNAYAEWYGNTMRIAESPTAQRHAELYGDAPYDAFLDQWKIENFDPESWMELFVETGADIVIPTTKHHDGVTLWDAPGTGTRNTVHRGPRRDLIADLAKAARSHGLRFGVYYSGGLDWSVTAFPPHTSHDGVHAMRPNDNAYNMYALAHLRDLVRRFQPDVLWNDIEWPDAGKHDGPGSLHEFLTEWYQQNPDGVINDRWGDTTWDYHTSEYEQARDIEVGTNWEQCRGIGLSFGYNQVEGSDQYLDGPGLARLLGDIVSRGGRLLLNVGPTADGRIPDIQASALRGLGRWMRLAKPYLVDAQPVSQAIAEASNEPWIRWLRTPNHLVALVDHPGQTDIVVHDDGFDLAAAEVVAHGQPTANLSDGHRSIRVSRQTAGDGPVIIAIPARS